ncbi:hypothetical protein [Citrobacter freundii]|uniref:hypothetical protein n=1 Tax=Citrobacter freundii TaxID=546 RepID=UPI001BCE10AD|nr:hypothetical protein [Citrobacter freundii]
MSNIDKQALRTDIEKRRGLPAFGLSPDENIQRLRLITETLKSFTPEVVEALLDELEASQKSNEFLKEQLSQLANFNPDWDKLEAATDSLREHMAKLSAAEKRIAELEARTVTVKLSADYRNDDGSINDDMFNTCEVVGAFRDALAAAGIGVKGE